MRTWITLSFIVHEYVGPTSRTHVVCLRLDVHKCIPTYWRRLGSSSEDRNHRFEVAAIVACAASTDIGTDFAGLHGTYQQHVIDSGPLDFFDLTEAIYSVPAPSVRYIHAHSAHGNCVCLRCLCVLFAVCIFLCDANRASIQRD
jgi:hypothetical protein